MSSKEFIELIVKYINNSININELKEIEKYLEDGKYDDLFKSYIEANYIADYEMKSFNTPDAKRELIDFVRKEKISKKSRTISLYKYAVAASIVLLISITFIFNQNRNQIHEPLIINSNIRIGTNKAILTLENGSDIHLEKGQQYRLDNLESNGEELIYTSINKPDREIAYNYLTIPRGGQYSVRLLDGTVVWLNSDSKIKYPISFVDGEIREVELIYGEAYFEVSPSSKHKGAKFKVVSNDVEIEVLGTKFNVKAYEDEDQIYTTLAEGKVTVDNSINKVVLEPNQQSIISVTDNEMEVVSVNASDETSWIKGEFVFSGKSLKEIMTVLSRWYDMDVFFLNQELETVKFIGVLGKEQNIEEVLLTIKNQGFINSYEINDKKLVLK